MAPKSVQNSATGDSFAFKYVLSCCAASVAESATYPFDLTKTRLQIQGENVSANSLHKRGMVRTAIGIAQEEGVTKLWQGVTPAILRHIVYTGCRLSIYEWLKGNAFGEAVDGAHPVWKSALAGLTAGALGQFIASPTDLVKVQMQMEGRRRLEGHAPRVKNTRHAFRKILAEGGLRGLWKGWVPNVQRAALVNLGELATYDASKQRILKHTNLGDNYVTHTLASVASGLASAITGTPADVVKTRIMNQPYKDGRGLLYRSSMDCLIKTVQNEGFFALYKGFIPIWSRMAPWSLIFWVSYEQIRKMFGASSF